MNKKYKISLTVLLILIIACVSLLMLKRVLYHQKENKAMVSSIVDNMENYGYSLDDRDTKIYKDTYYELKELLSAEEVNYEEYGQKLTKLFVIDLFTLSNKVNKYDVGGLEFIYNSEKEMFKNKVMDTLYEDLEDNSYDTRNQQLSTVSAVIIDESKETTYQLDDDKELSGYEYIINIEYEEDLGYDNKAKVIVVRDDNKMYVVKYTADN